MGKKMKILFVCSGNTCRSPMAEAYLRHLLREQGRDDIIVESAGLAAWPGTPASEQAIKVLAEEGIDLRGHRARQVTPEMIEAADLVLTMTWDHKQSLLKHVPQGKGKVFTLKELGADPQLKAAMAPREELCRRIQEKETAFLQEHQAEIRELQERRDRLIRELEEVEGRLQDWESKLQAVTAEERKKLEEMRENLSLLDVRDPFGQPEGEYRSCFQEIRRSLDKILAKLEQADEGKYS